MSPAPKILNLLRADEASEYINGPNEITEGIDYKFDDDDERLEEEE